MAASTSVASPNDILNTSSTQSKNDDQPANVFDGSIRVVVQRPHSRFFLRTLMLTASTAGGDVMRQLREIRDQEISRIIIWKPAKRALWFTVIEIVSLSTFRLEDIEAQPSQHLLEVIVSSRTLSPELTAAFHHSWLLQSSASFTDQYPSLLSSSPSRTALLIGQELNKRAIFWVFFAALLISLVIGLVVGFVCSRADLAVAVTGGLTGIISVFTALLVWILK